MRVLLVHKTKAKHYSEPVPPMKWDAVVHTSVGEIFDANGHVASGLPGWAFDIIVLPDWSELPPDTIEWLKTRLAVNGMMVVL